jgi:cardiolipin synthase A/B
MQTLLLTLVGLLVPLFAALSAGHALLNKRDPRSALGWVLCCLLLPILGPFLYLSFGINRTFSSARKMRPESGDDGVVIDFAECPDATRFPLTMIGRKVTHKELLPCTSFDVLINGDEAYPRMLEAIRDAGRHVYLATYIFANGKIADQFLEELHHAIERGVEVKVILDGMGESMSFPPMGWSLRKHGIPFLRFNPFTLFPPSLHINLRNHRKMLLVDGTVAFTGGMNLADKNCHQLAGPHIQDVHFRVNGPVILDLEYAFLKDWHYCGGNKDAFHYDHPHWHDIRIEADTVWSRLVLDGPNEYLDKLADILAGVISSAQERVWIMTPYFLPDARLIGMLQTASLRNVDVKIVLPQENNILVADWATRHLLWQLLNYGIEVYYQAAPFSHSKLLIVDGSYSLIGSANLDPRSLRLNYELSLEMFSENVNQQLEGYFREKMASALRYRSKDRASRSLPVRLRDAAAWLFSPYL